MKKIITIIIISTLILSSSLTFAFSVTSGTYRVEKRVNGYSPFTWSAYANANFYRDNGAYASFDGLTKVNKPADTPSYRYEVSSWSTGYSTYESRQQVQSKRTNRTTGVVDIKVVPVTINSGGGM